MVWRYEKDGGGSRNFDASWMSMCTPFSAPRESTQNCETHGRNAKESQVHGA